MVTASTTVLSWLLKTLMLKKEVLPLMVNDMVPQTLEMETSCSTYFSVVKLQLVREEMAAKKLAKKCITFVCAAWSLGPPAQANKKRA